MLVFMFVSEVGRLASLAWLASRGARFHRGLYMCLHVGIYVCVGRGAPCETRFARLARRPLSLWTP